MSCPARRSDVERHKEEIRLRVWRELRKVAHPDSRFHWDFSSFIADFDGSDSATERLTRLPAWRAAELLFITPDNCLDKLRYCALRDKKRFLTTTYGIGRGFLLVDPAAQTTPPDPAGEPLDAIERRGSPVTLEQIRDARWTVSTLVTGTGAVNTRGVRFGKGHGYFDLEWAMLLSIGAVTPATPAICVAHDCQIVDEELVPDVFDTVCDLVVTNTRTVEVEAAVKPDCGILWDRLQVGMLDIPPLRELRDMRRWARGTAGVEERYVPPL